MDQALIPISTILKFPAQVSYQSYNVLLEFCQLIFLAKFEKNNYLFCWISTETVKNFYEITKQLIDFSL